MGKIRGGGNYASKYGSFNAISMERIPLSCDKLVVGRGKHCRQKKVLYLTLQATCPGRPLPSTTIKVHSLLLPVADTST
jgi:hypothetical protein